MNEKQESKENNKKLDHVICGGCRKPLYSYSDIKEHESIHIREGLIKVFIYGIIVGVAGCLLLGGVI